MLSKKGLGKSPRGQRRNQDSERSVAGLVRAVILHLRGAAKMNTIPPDEFEDPT
jgi:hypothetical protein